MAAFTKLENCCISALTTVVAMSKTNMQFGAVPRQRSHNSEQLQRAKASLTRNTTCNSGPKRMRRSASWHHTKRIFIHENEMNTIIQQSKETPRKTRSPWFHA